MDGIGPGGGLPGKWVQSRTNRDAELLIEERRRSSPRGGYQTWTRPQRRLFWLAAIPVVAVVLVVTLVMQVVG